MDKNLTPQQHRFVREYLVDMNQTKAARRAGYSPTSAAGIASELMKQPKIKEAIAIEQDKLKDKFGITPERIIQELSKIAFANIQDFMCLDEDGVAVIDLAAIDQDKASALDVSFEITKGRGKTVSTKIKLLDKQAALLQIGKHLGMFADKVDHKVSLTLEQLVAQSMEPLQVEQPKPVAIEHKPTPLILDESGKPKTDPCMEEIGDPVDVD